MQKKKKKEGERDRVKVRIQFEKPITIWYVAALWLDRVSSKGADEQLAGLRMAVFAENELLQIKQGSPVIEFTSYEAWQPM